MIKATINKGEVSCHIEGRGIRILSELTVFVDRVLDKIADDDKAAKDELVDVFCKARAHITRLENRQVLPAQYGAVLEALAALGLVKYDETLDMLDRYTADYMANLNRGNE